MIQARMGSTRLPGKVMKKILDKPMLQLLIDRVKFSNKIDSIIVVTANGDENEPIRLLCDNLNVDCFSGDEDDVLDRYYQAALQYNLSDDDHIIRITADCPLIDPTIMDEVIDEHLNNNHDYTANTIICTYPDGLDCEIFKFSVLKNAWENANLKSEREHVTLYIRNNSELYNLGNTEYKDDLSNLRWTVDEPEDFLLVKQIYEQLYDENNIFLMEDILKLLNSDSALFEINNMYERNEGLKKSLDNDEVIR